MSESVKYWLVLLVVVLAFFALYLFNIDGWLVADDEGTDFYEVWQYHEGKQPGIDFIAEQQPLFLLAGSTIVGVAGQQAAPLRILAAGQVLLGALALALVVRWIWNRYVAVLSLGLILGSGLVYEQARLFRPDPMMFAWELAGLGAALRAASGDGERRMWWAVAGGCYGVAFLWKPFALFPIVGLIFYFVERLWRERDHWRATFRSGLVFSGLFLLVGAGFSLALYAGSDFYYLEAFQQHAKLGQANSFGIQILKAVSNFVHFLVINPLWLSLFPLLWLHRGHEWSGRREGRLLVWQLVSPIVLLGVTRPVFPRYLLYLAPVFAILFAWHAYLALENTLQPPSKVGRVFAIAVPILIGLQLLTSIQPFSPDNVLEVATRRETDTLALAGFVASQTEPGDVVLADYATINFHANRPSIYEASIIAGGRIRGGIITGQLLKKRIEEEDVKMVLLHVEGGQTGPDHMVKLVDYDAFRDYLLGNFVLLTTFDRAGQQIEVYKRQEGSDG